jgi:hypothetical protein
MTIPPGISSLALCLMTKTPATLSLATRLMTLTHDPGLLYPRLLCLMIPPAILSLILLIFNSSSSQSLTLFFTTSILLPHYIHTYPSCLLYTHPLTLFHSSTHPYSLSTFFFHLAQISSSLISINLSSIYIEYSTLLYPLSHPSTPVSPILHNSQSPCTTCHPLQSSTQSCSQSSLLSLFYIHFYSLIQALHPSPASLFVFFLFSLFSSLHSSQFSNPHFLLKTTILSILLHSIPFLSLIFLLQFY